MLNIAIINMGKVNDDLEPEFGNFSSLFMRAMDKLQANADYSVHWVDKVQWQDLAQADGIILTGAHEGVYDNLPWRSHFEPVMQQILESDIPLLAVCFGHQFLAETLGGKVEHSPDNSETGHIKVELSKSGKKDALFVGVPSSAGFIAVHNDMVTIVPPKTEILAYNETVPVEAFRYGKNKWATQFHPEMDAAQGIVVVNKSLEGDKLEQALESIDNPQYGLTIMENFLKICG